MRVVVLGGTRFIGRAVVTELLGNGHDVAVVHRGVHEPADPGPVVHIHTDRSHLQDVASDLRDFDPEAAVDVSAMNGAAAGGALDALPSGLRLVALSSGDVYRAFASLRDGIQTDAVPLDEDAALRSGRFFVAPDDENLEVEEAYLSRGAVVLRLAAVYGEEDYQRRHDFVLRRLVAGRDRIPIGKGNLLLSRLYVRDAAKAVRLALESAGQGEVYNVAESATWSMRLLAEKVIESTDYEAQLVTVEDSDLPRDLRITSFVGQQMLMNSQRIRSDLGWSETDRDEALRVAVRWEDSDPPDEEYLEGLEERIGCSYRDFSADDIALSRAG